MSPGLKRIAKKLLGRQYDSLRRAFLRIYIPRLAKRFAGLEGDIISREESFYLRRIRPKDFRGIFEFYRKEISDSEKRMISEMTMSKLRKRSWLFFGLYRSEVLAGYCLVRIRGYRYVELGVAVSKYSRRQGLAGIMMSRLEGYCREIGVEYFVRIDRKNAASVAFFSSRGYYIWKKEESIVYMKQ